MQIETVQLKRRNEEVIEVKWYGILWICQGKQRGWDERTDGKKLQVPKSPAHAQI